MKTQETNTEVAQYIQALMILVFICILADSKKGEETKSKKSWAKQQSSHQSPSIIDKSEANLVEQISTVMQNINYTLSIASTNDNSKFSLSASIKSPNFVVQKIPISLEATVSGQTVDDFVHKIKHNYRACINLNDVNEKLSDFLEKNGRCQLYAFVSHDVYERKLIPNSAELIQKANSIGIALDFDHVNLFLQKTQHSNQLISLGFNFTIKSRLSNKSIILDRKTSNHLKALQKKNNFNFQGGKKNIKNQTASITSSYEEIIHDNELFKMPNVSYTPEQDECLLHSFRNRNVGIVDSPTSLSQLVQQNKPSTCVHLAASPDTFSILSAQTEPSVVTLIGFAVAGMTSVGWWLRRQYHRTQDLIQDELNLDARIAELGQAEMAELGQAEMAEFPELGPRRSNALDGDPSPNWLKLVNKTLNTPVGVISLSAALVVILLKKFGPSITAEAKKYQLIIQATGLIVTVALIIANTVPKKIIIVQPEKSEGNDDDQKKKITKTPTPKDPGDSQELKLFKAFEKYEPIDMSSGTGNNRWNRSLNGQFKINTKNA
jgi:hypothetical protein